MTSPQKQKTKAALYDLAHDVAGAVLIGILFALLALL